MSRAICTVGINEQRQFWKYNERFRITFGQLGCCDELNVYDTRWPPGSPTHQEVHYAFKIYAVKAARDAGNEQVLWCDCSANAVKPIEPLWQYILEHGVYLAGDPPLDHELGRCNPVPEVFDRLGNWSSDRALETFGVSRDEAMKITLLCGSCFGFDFRHAKANKFLDEMFKYANGLHFNGTHFSRLVGVVPGLTEGQQVSTDPRVQGHRSDEAYMTLIAREMKISSSGEYFTGGNAVRPSTVIRSGYDLP